MEEFANLVKCGVAPEDECVEWGAGLAEGYGAINVTLRDGRRTVLRAHRAVREILEGPSGLMVLHSCGNRACFNPGHTRYGSPAENVEDMYRLGETAEFGEGSYHAKLARGEVDEIKELYFSSGLSQREVGLIYGVGQSAVSSIVRGKSWVRS